MNQNDGVIRRVLTGMRTTGELHLGHKKGALDLWIDAQNSGLDCYFLLADLQALTTHADRPELIRKSVRDVVLDWMSVGIDPTLPNVHLVLQSAVLPRALISQILLNNVRLNEVMDNPTIKAESKGDPNPNLGFLTYPVDQWADVCMMSPKNIAPNELLVPVGYDQIPHLEYARKWARRFNALYNAPVFRPCTPRVGKIGRLVGIDGDDKMSKSLGNAIMLTDDVQTVNKKIMKLKTDPNRVHATDPGTVRGNPLFMYLVAFEPEKDYILETARLYRQGKIGDVAIKARLAKRINEELGPIRERRAQAENEPYMDYVREGSKRATQISLEVLHRMKEAMSLEIF